MYLHIFESLDEKTIYERVHSKFANVKLMANYLFFFENDWRKTECHLFHIHFYQNICKIVPAFQTVESEKALFYFLKPLFEVSLLIED
jgi:hypothetical protein